MTKRAIGSHRTTPEKAKTPRMASASDQPPAAAPASSAPGPLVSGQLPNGAGFGKTTASISSTPPPPPPALGHAPTTVNGISRSSSTATLADYKSPPAQVVSDIPAAAAGSSSASASTSVNSVAIRPSNSNNTLPSASRSPALPSTPSSSAQVLSQTGTNLKRWVSSTLAAPDPPPAPTVDQVRSTGTPTLAPRQSVGFPSPKSGAMETDHKFLDDCDRIKFGIKQALPEAVRRSVRDSWEKCLLGSAFHQAFVLNASIHHATPAAIQRGMRDFGKTLIDSAKADIVKQMTPDDLDELADLILSKASHTFCDKALEKRLKTIDAKRLINALARAERLGYELSDVQDEEEDMAPVPPSQQPMQSSPALSTPASPTPGPSLPGQLGAAVLHCLVCFRRFPAQSAYNYHVKHQVCTRSPKSPGGFKYSCLHCGQGFATPMGLQYHNTNHVCGDFGEPTKASLVRKPLAPSGIQSHTPIPVPSIPPHIATRTSSPVMLSASKSTSPAPSPGGNLVLAGDPYAHLSPEQLAALQSELREAEVAFTERMRQASLLIDPAEKKVKLEKLSNSFHTKQSNIRKKYGVRLRQRRSNTEIQQERERMQYKTASEIQAEMGVVNRGPGRPPLGGNVSTHQPEVKIAAAPGTGNGWAPVNQQPTTTLASNMTEPASKIIPSTDVSMHSGKRRFSGGETSDSKRVAYANMGGLTGATAEAETRNPSLRKGSSGAGTKEEPMALDDSTSSEDSDATGSDSADEDIPAELPASVKQTLGRSSPAGGGNRSRPESTSAEAGV